MLEQMFTKKEAIAFLESSWEIKDVEERLKNDRKSLLDEIVTAIISHVPFQSITLLATSPGEHKLPSYEEIKKDCMAGVGGLCYSINTFTYGLLKGLGFSAQLSVSTVTSTVTSPNNHVIILVSSLEKDGDLFLVDCGTGFPIFRAVPLDFGQESPIYHDGFLEYKFIRHDGQILRMHGAGDMAKHNDPPIEGLDFIVGRWRRFYSFTLAEWREQIQDIGSHYKETIYCTPFATSFRALWFPRKRAVVVVNNRFIIETEEGKMASTVMGSDEEIVKCLRENFPAFSEEVAQRAVIEWRKHSI